MFPAVSAPADIPISLSQLRAALPGLSNVRLLSIAVLKNDEERTAFADAGWTFSVSGDFDLDGVVDLVVAGRFDNPRDPEDQTFVAILTKTKAGWRQRLVLRPKLPLAVLRTTNHPDATMASKGYVAIFASFTVEFSDDYVLIFWDGSKYRYESGFEISSREIRNRLKQ